MLELIKTPGYNNIEYAGISKREYFAAMAMQGILSYKGCIVDNKILAEITLNYADALIEELTK